MNRWIRGTLLGVAGLAAAAGAALGTGLTLAQWRQARHVEVPVRAIALRDDAAARQRGAHLYGSRGCQDCHGADGAGREFLNDGRGLVVRGPQIAPGPGSVTAGYGATDWERSIRHGVNPQGRALQVMPSQDYAGMADADLEALVAHVRALPPVNAASPEQAAGAVRLPLAVRALYGYGVIPDAASRIDHAAVAPAAMHPSDDAGYGRYVAQMCTGCHGAALEGGPIPGGPPDWPAAADLRGAAMTRYPTAEAFARMLRSGRRPDGSAVQVMPFEALSQLDDVEVSALHRYLVSLKGAD